MSMQDAFGNPVSGADDLALSGINDFLQGFIGYTPKILAPFTLAQSGHEHPLVNIYAGWLWMFSESPAGFGQARATLSRIDNRYALTPREKGSAQALEHWIAGEVSEALACLEQVLSIAPRDVAALKLHQYLSFNRGRCADMLRIALQAESALSDVPQLHGMLAFGYEQCHLLAEAELSATRALQLYAAEPWAQHALAHVYLTRGAIQTGLQFLQERTSDWSDLTSFMYTHNWWHLAVFYISEGRFEDALQIYDVHVWNRDRQYSQDQVGAVSLLARLELAGCSVDGRWHGLADYLKDRHSDVVEPFLTLQYLYGLARAGRAEVAELQAAIERRASAVSDASGVWQDVALPVSRAMVAQALGDHDRCVRLLGPALGRMLELGGSHAQRDLFHQLYLDSLIKSGADSAAQQLLEQRRSYEPNGVPLNRALAAVYARLGLPVQARVAANRAARGC